MNQIDNKITTNNSIITANQAHNQTQSTFGSMFSFVTDFTSETVTKITIFFKDAFDDKCHIQDQPKEIVELIISAIKTPKDLIHFSMTCTGVFKATVLSKSWHTLIIDSSFVRCQESSNDVTKAITAFDDAFLQLFGVDRAVLILGRAMASSMTFINQPAGDAAQQAMKDAILQQHKNETIHQTIIAQYERVQKSMKY